MAKPSLELIYTNLEDSTMKNGIITLPKVLHYKVADGAEPKEYSALDVYEHKTFPMIISALAEDAEFTFQGDATIKKEATEDGTWFHVTCNYTTKNPNAGINIKIGGGEKAPWKFPPKEAKFTHGEVKMPFRMAYNAAGAAVIPVTNVVGDHLHEDYLNNYTEMKFEYDTKSWNHTNGNVYGNSVNLNTEIICGYTFAPGTVMLYRPNATYKEVYDGNRIKWKYWHVEITLQIDPTGNLYTKRLWDVGNRAYFPAFTFYDDLIGPIPVPASPGLDYVCKFRGTTGVLLQGTTIYAQTHPQTWIKGLYQFTYVQRMEFVTAGLISSNKYEMKCEQLKDVPLLPTGEVDIPAYEMNSKGTMLSFMAYPQLSWAPLNLPLKMG